MTVCRTRTDARPRRCGKLTSALPAKKLVALVASLGLGLMLLMLTKHPARCQSPPQKPTQAVALTRGPYLQSVTTDSVIIVWDTDQLATSRVDYGPTTTYGLGVNSIVPVTHHALTLTVPHPYSIYHYQISSNGQYLGGDNTFRTAAPPAQTAFSFVALGDTQTGTTTHRSLVNRMVDLAPDFVLHTGDLVNNGKNAEEWTEFFTIEHDLLRQSPLFGALGNHERNSKYYFDAFHLPNNERWYSFDYGDAHFIALEIDGYARYTRGSAQYTWLENDLANTDRLWKIVFFHYPPHSSGKHGGNTSVRNALGPLFAHYGVDLVFNGHDHGYERSIADGTTYIVTGGGGGLLYKERPDRNPYSVYFFSSHHYVSASIDGGTLVSVGIRPDGKLFDLFTLYKPSTGDYSLFLPLILREHSGTRITILPATPQPTHGPR
jgi:hypothetical protein